MRYLISILFVAVAFAAAAAPGLEFPFPCRVYKFQKELSFVKSGHLQCIELYNKEGSAFGKLYIYSRPGGGPYILDGSPSALERVIEFEMHGAVTDDFIASRLADALLAMSTCEQAYLIDSKVIAAFGALKLSGDDKAMMHSALTIMKPPASTIQKNQWDIQFQYFTRNGQMYSASYSGSKSPFKIDSHKTLLIENSVPSGVLTGEGQVFDKQDE